MESCFFSLILPGYIRLVLILALLFVRTVDFLIPNSSNTDALVFPTCQKTDMLGRPLTRRRILKHRYLASWKIQSAEDP